MPRERSSSRDRVKSRKDPDRDRKDRKDRDSNRHSKSSRRSRSRSRSPRHSKRELNSPSPKRSIRKDRHRSPSPDYLTLGNVKPKFATRTTRDDDKPLILDPLAFEGKTEEEIEMMKMMGFSGFETTKGKHVEGSANASAVNIQQKRKYRQYMNRKGGFNRPLDSCP